MSTFEQVGGLDRYLNDPHVTRAVRAWARDQGFVATVPAAPWRRRGGSGALLVRLHIVVPAHERLSADLLVKVCSAGSPAREPANHQRAWRDSPVFATRHLFRQIYPPVALADGRVLMFLDSSSSLTAAVTLGQLPGAARLDGGVATIRLVLGDWNSPNSRERRTSSVEQFLAAELRGVLDRGRSAYTWARDAGLIPDARAGDVRAGLPDLARRFQLTSELAGAVEFLAGRSHGDLHVDNIIVSRTPDGELDFEGIRLIDLSAFDPRAPLSRDVAALLLSLIFPAVRSGAVPSLVDALTSAAPATATPRTALERVVNSVRLEAVKQVESRDQAMFHRQYLLSLIAQSVTYTSYDNAGEDGRLWYLRLGAAAAHAYRSFGAGPSGHHA
ncbi:hypothetical protein [Actinoplanes sp. NPDC048796]|uniref:hypothetical protein n=1 Tax=Actinoplanes sp. NPDC048796 TaxID=3155640 RepID=UPI0033E86285